EQFIAALLPELPDGVAYMIVSEAGASVYSASKLAAEEFPQFDVSLRSAVSIARRMQDPLAELVKIDPKAIGVGQYQHDLKESQLEEALGGVVEGCVNSVGVEISTASAPLLSHVAGIGPALAKNIVAYREEYGLTSRAQLKKVPKLGAKAFEQCAGFLRVRESRNVLDATAVHPESYDAAKALLNSLGFQLEDVRRGKLQGVQQRVEERGIKTLAVELNIGEPTLTDILRELQKPGRDPRDDLPKPMLRTDVLDIKDLQPGMELMGTVRNVIDFGAFIDIGVHQDGLAHISRMSDRFIKHPSEVVKVGDVVKVWVVEVDMKKMRIALTMIPPRISGEGGKL
ncbi:MAG: helix-hairpin-helix domain-containing protein, partial [Clostridia bacterium]|nr:helix-hairpin-helix domain-containing protein [Clostridia bacterium]